MGVLLRKDDDGVMGGVTGGVRLPLVWRGGVDTLPRDRLPVSASDNLGCAFFLAASCSRRAASVMNLEDDRGSADRPEQPIVISVIYSNPSRCDLETAGGQKALMCHFSIAALHQ